MRFEALYRVAFSLDGTKVAIADGNYTASVWDIETGQPLGEPMHHKKMVNHIEFSRDGTKIATGSEDGVARIWDVQTGRPLGSPLNHNGQVWHVGFSPDGGKVATGSWGSGQIGAVSPTLILDDPELESWLDVMTSFRMEKSGELKYLNSEDWLDARKKLDGIKNWKDHLAAEKLRHEFSYWNEAENAESNKQWFAAAFHLRWALKKEPGNEEVKKRLAAAEQKLKEEQEAAKQAGPKRGGTMISAPLQGFVIHASSNPGLRPAKRRAPPWATLAPPLRG